VFGRATITLGIGPHILVDFFNITDLQVAPQTLLTP